MLRFFRKMRNALIPDSRFGRYFFYALGEIVLVVIGILIALQVNNWNEDRKNLIGAEKQLLTLKQNISDDIKQIVRLDKEMDTLIFYSKILMEQFKTNIPINYNTPYYIFYLILEHHFNPNRSGLNTITNEGLMAYIDEDIKNNILNYYELLEQINSREQISNSIIHTFLEPYLIDNYSEIFNKNNPFPHFKEIYANDPRIPEPLDNEKLLSDKKLENLITNRLYQSRKQKELYTQSLGLANEILTQINKQ